MAKHPHTPGPWTLNAEAAHPWLVECPQRGMPKEIKGEVCKVSYLPNASLIAAAPEILAALSGLILCMDLFRASDGNQQDAYYLLAKQDAAWAAASAAISKAGA